MPDMRERFLTIAADPRIIPGVHHHCDDWCDYCRVSDRCLAFRCTNEYRKAHSRKHGEETFSCIDEAVAFTRDLSAVEGVSTAALDALLGNGSAPPEVTRDPLAVSAWDYAVAVALAYGPQSLAAPDGPPKRSEPSPEDVLLWYHLRIYMRVFRAIAAVHGTGLRADNSDEALGSAKLALCCIKRSKDAVMRLAEPTGRSTVGELASQLDALECCVRERFPNADAYVRLGLDMPVA
jgi:hypothetical protein